MNRINRILPDIKNIIFRLVYMRKLYYVHKDLLFHTSNIKKFCQHYHCLSDHKMREDNNNNIYYIYWYLTRSTYYIAINNNDKPILLRHECQLKKISGESNDSYIARLESCKDDSYKAWFIDY